MADGQQIYVVHDDPSIRRALSMLLTTAHFSVTTFTTPAEFLGDPGHKQGCLIIDVRTPGINWLEFQIAVARQTHDLVMLAISTDGDLPTIVGAIDAGIIDFIEKPFDGEHILACVRRALAIKAKTHDTVVERDDARREIARLTERERTVAAELAKGRSNKIVAHELGISPRTVEIHRARILKKLNIAKVSGLVRLWHQAGELAPFSDLDKSVSMSGPATASPAHDHSPGRELNRRIAGSRPRARHSHSH
jgi:two-component system response regulator FixJ